MLKYSEKLADINRLGNRIAEACILAALDIVDDGIGAYRNYRDISPRGFHALMSSCITSLPSEGINPSLTLL